MSSICLHNGTVLTGFAAMEDCAVLVSDGVIVDVFMDKRLSKKHIPPDARWIDVKGAYIAPGFIDTHIHGTGGFGTDQNDPQALLELSRVLPRYGVTSFIPTLYPAPREELLSALRAFAAVLGREEGAHIAGFHLEGPFVSPSMLGVQRPETLSPVDLNFMEALWDASGGHIVNMTVAPELKGMRELALYCIKKGIVLQAGHSAAAYENMVEGMQVGILHSTHLFNAMSKLDHRNPNAVGAILIHPELSCEIIADGQHVHPDLVRLLRREKPLDKIVLVTDALTPTGLEGGRLVANGQEVVLQDGVFQRAADGVIAGSSLTMLQGVKNLVSWGFTVEEAVKTASSTPAQVMHFAKKGAIIPGNDADLVVFDASFTLRATMVGGTLLQENNT